jgi:hypothetical protein
MSVSDYDSVSVVSYDQTLGTGSRGNSHTSSFRKFQKVAQHAPKSKQAKLLKKIR